jgi:hypothetical protein
MYIFFAGSLKRPVARTERFSLNRSSSPAPGGLVAQRGAADAPQTVCEEAVVESVIWVEEIWRSVGLESLG